MATTLAGGHPQGFAATLRSDPWWIGPLLTVLGLGMFFGYATWRAFMGAYYFADPYLSPFYAPLLFVKEGVAGGAPVHHAWLGAWPTWWPDFVLLPASPAIFILVFPGAFRLTCYYYRKAYYRIAGLPPGCAVNPLPLEHYRGETRFLLFQNLHRFALYFAVAFIFILLWDGLKSFSKHGELGVGVGSLIMMLNPILLGAYTFGCHSWRHLVGGQLDCFSCSKTASARHGIWKGVSWLNARHAMWAWISLFWVGFTDVYIYLVSKGVIPDLNTWN